METWVTIKNYESLYEVSDLGRVRSLSLNRGRILRPDTHRNGYQFVSLVKNGGASKKSIHRLVLSGFVKLDPIRNCGNHKDGIKSNNRVENLEWCTHSENTQHALRTGLLKPLFGERQNGAKLTNDKVLRMRELRESGMKLKGLEILFGVNNSTISSICSRKSWKHV